MSKIDLLIKYGRNTLNKCKQTNSVINNHSNAINDGLNKTFDISSQVNTGRDLIRFSRQATSISPNFAENYGKTVNEIMNKHFEELELTQNLSDRQKKN